MKLSDVLQGISRLYVETAPLIYYVEENPAYIARIDAVIEYLKRVPIKGVCSALTLTEVLTIPVRIGDTALINEYRDILLNSREFECVPVSLIMGETAADLRARYNLKTPDALHIAAAIVSGCDGFLTNDLGLRRVTEIRVLVLNELELDT